MKKIFYIILIFNSLLCLSQQAEIDTLKTPEIISKEITEINAPPPVQTFNPTKAGLYSAILPGLGQIYNKKYWKAPLAIGGIGVGVGICIWNDNHYQRYRRAFIAELNGQENEFSHMNWQNPAEVLGRNQDRMKRQRDYAIALTALWYVINIMDAVVDAHLYQQRHDPDLALSPAVLNDFHGNPAAGLAVAFKF